MSFEHQKTSEFSERRLDIQEIADWAQTRNFEVVHHDEGANVVAVGEDHTDFGTFAAEQELIEKCKPNYVILEGLAAGKEIKNRPRFWSLAEAGLVLGVDVQAYAGKILELANQILTRFASEEMAERRAEGRLEESDTLENIKNEHKGIYPYPETREQLLNLPFYLWPYCIKDGFKQLQRAEKQEPINQVARVVDKMAPEDDIRFKGGKTAAFALIHSAAKVGSRVVGMDDDEAKRKILAVIKQANTRRYESLGIKLAAEDSVADEAMIDDIVELQTLLTSIDFTEEERQTISEQSKFRRETMAQSIAERTVDGSSAVVITGSRHIEPDDAENYIPMGSAGIKRLSIKQREKADSGFFDGSDYINQLTR